MQVFHRHASAQHPCPTVLALRVRRNWRLTSPLRRKNWKFVSQLRRRKWMRSLRIRYDVFGEVPTETSRLGNCSRRTHYKIRKTLIILHQQCWTSMAKSRMTDVEHVFTATLHTRRPLYDPEFFLHPFHEDDRCWGSTKTVEIFEDCSPP